MTSDHDSSPPTPEPAEHPETIAETGGETAGAPGKGTTLVAVGGGIAWRLIVFLLFALVLVVFAVQNTDPVDLRFLGWSWSVPLAIVLIGVIAVTVLLDELFGFFWRRRRARDAVARRS